MIISKRNELQDQVKAVEGYWTEIRDIEEEINDDCQRDHRQRK
jgi:hypothetical protein